MDRRRRVRHGLFVVLAIGGGLAPVALQAQPPTRSITGRVVDGNGVGLAAVSVTLATAGAPPVAATSDGNGNFVVVGLAPAAYSVTPAAPSLVFAPASRTVSLASASATLAPFVGTTPTYALAGYVVDPTGSPLSGVTVAMSGSTVASTTTDAIGRYAFAGVPAHGSVSVALAAVGFTFVPAQQTFADVQDDVDAAPAVATAGAYRRYLAEGAVNTFFDTTIALLNPTTTATTARVVFQPSTGSPVERQIPVAARTRVTVNPKAHGLTNADFSTVVESSQPLVVDRTMRWDATGYGSHAESSLAQPLTTWYFAEGATTGQFQLFYLLQNPGTTAAEVEIRYLRPTPAPPIVKTYVVAPASRRTVYVNQEDPALDEAEISAVITATNGVPILAERAMYTDARGQVFGAGHDGAGLPAPASQWFLAEGATGPFFHQFILVANPTATPAPLEFRYLLMDGRVITKTHLAAPNSRLTIGVHAEDPVLAQGAMSTIVTSTTGVPVLVERAMWWPATGPWYEAHVSAGATATGTSWAVADGEAGGADGSETYLLVANTAAFAGSASVTLLFEDGTSATRTIPLLPSSRTNVATGATFPEAVGRRFGAIVESLGPRPAPIVVERAIYANAGGVVWASGSNLLATRLQGRLETAVIGAPSTQPPGSRVSTAGILGAPPETPGPLAVPDVVAERTTPLAEIATDADGHRVVRTKIEITFRRTATVAQINGVLDTIGGRIVNAIAGVPILLVRVPDPGSIEALDAMVARVEGQPGVAYVARVFVPDPAVLPDTHLAGGPLDTIDHLLAARVPAAWNAASALDASAARLPLVVVTDFFGAGPPNAAVDATTVGTDFSTGGIVEHGYHVLAIMQGAFADVPSLLAGPNTVVGLFPRRADVRVFDFVAPHAVLVDLSAHSNDTLRYVRDSPGRVVVNSSIQYLPVLPQADAVRHAQAWSEKVRTAGSGGSSLEPWFVQSQAAGNAIGMLAALASDAGGATQIQNLRDSSGALVPNLANTLVVENLVATPAEPFDPGCRALSSNIGGTIAAVGVNVFSLRDPGTLAGDKTGTSMAAPQVAALATYIWSLAPNLSAAQVVARIRATARPGVSMTSSACSPIAVATSPAIDAYAALLSVDSGLSAPVVRATLLDVADTSGAGTPDGRFDEHDIEVFLTEFGSRAGTDLDYSRYDLNGDGRTGGTTGARFDLDANVLPAWTTLTQTIESTPTSFDETALTDVKILCYYAYSSLYAGDPASRTTLLDGQCLAAAASPFIHFLQMRVSQTTGLGFSDSFNQQFDRPDSLTDMLTPWLFEHTRAQTGSFGTVSHVSRVEDDHLTMVAGGLTGGSQRWTGSCTGDTAPAIPAAGVNDQLQYQSRISFTISQPRVRIDWQGTLSPAGASGSVVSPGTAQGTATIFGGSGSGRTLLNATTTSAQGPVPLNGSAEITPGPYEIDLNVGVRCYASNADNIPSVTANGGVTLTFTLTPLP